MFSSSSVQLLFISELPTSCQPATRFHRICEIREREPEGKSFTLLFRIQCCILILCQRKNSVLLETMYVDKIAKFSGEVKATFYNLCHEIFSHRFREGVRGFWTFPTSTSYPPPPPPHIPCGYWNQCFSKERIASYFSRIRDQLRVSATLQKALINNF